MQNDLNNMYISRRKILSGLLATGAGLSIDFATALSTFAQTVPPQNLKATIKTSQVAIKKQWLTSKKGKAALKSYPLKMNTQAAPMSANAQAAFSRYPVKTTSNPGLFGLAKGDTGSDFWFTESSANRIGKITTQGTITEYLLPLEGYSPNRGIANGPGDAIWFGYDPLTDQTPFFAPFYIGYIVGGSGKVTLYELPNNLVVFIAIGPLVRGSDDTLWFGNGTTTGGTLGRMTPDGHLTMYTLGSVYGGPYSLALGPDEALWFDVVGANGNQNGIGRFTTSGDYTFYAVPEILNSDVIAGTENDVWFSLGASSNNSIGRITTSGQLTRYYLPNHVVPNQLARLSNGAIAFSSINPTAQIGILTQKGDVQLFKMPESSIVNDMIYAGWTNEVWFTIPEAIYKFRVTS
ncbi:hypothetical protein KSF_063810 [Reticulibacter mediterranei]|uniref:Uncharacterized protein n=1 Tax=Reticulibacter mediterranei TaxID=2778369 RepID=A0A8J3ILX2_9CHLR|nr:hypothetical protein [Reticulibacter mediterranei]GHO96333.1 hypothetical protein KSF_063810 [Reticulibacter mediterranei]